MANSSKREQIDRTIDNIFKLLEKVGREPGSYAENVDVLEALKRQGGLCALNLNFSINGEPFQIRPISLNTFKKRLAFDANNRNFEQFDRLRIYALGAIKKLGDSQPNSNRRTRTSLEDRIEELQTTVSSLHAVNMVLIQALEVNRRDLLTIADTPNVGLRQKRVSDAINRIIRILGMNPAPYDDVAILSMKQHLQLVPNDNAKN